MAPSDKAWLASFHLTTPLLADCNQTPSPKRSSHVPKKPTSWSFDALPLYSQVYTSATATSPTTTTRTDWSVELVTLRHRLDVNLTAIYHRLDELQNERTESQDLLGLTIAVPSPSQPTVGKTFMQTSTWLDAVSASSMIEQLQRQVAQLESKLSVAIEEERKSWQTGLDEIQAKWTIQMNQVVTAIQKSDPSEHSPPQDEDYEQISIEIDIAHQDDNTMVQLQEAEALELVVDEAAPHESADDEDDCDGERWEFI
ncbi:hypothetical protein AC1031_012448 [Aphanomyces cochlioides]|nr:hypothetical protein AC1031_012448 [Aphanomyces cochlioides]